MSQKKPIWTTVEAHARLKEYCAVAGRTQLDVVSELILTYLDPAKAKRQAQGGDNKQSGDERHFGGVWVV